MSGFVAVLDENRSLRGFTPKNDDREIEHRGAEYVAGGPCHMDSLDGIRVWMRCRDGQGESN
jgi:hypothetical protein